jgi:adenosylcobinamide-GDP ribazoletransferase
MIDGLRTAFGLLTVLPAGGNRWAPARAVAWYPLVGVVLAALLAGSAALLYHALSPLLAAALTVALWVLLTGALHFDGLADTADAAFAPVAPERRLDILRDVHHGTFALVAVVLVLALKVAALATFDGRAAAGAAVLAVVVGRAALLPVMRLFRPARSGGMGEASRTGAHSAAIGVAIAVAAAAALLAFGGQGLALAAGLFLLALASAAWLSGRFGGLSGDCYGAIIEILEMFALVATSALVTNGHASAFPLGGRL